MNSQTDFWHVRLPNGSVCTLTLDELDDAFQAGQIDENIFVLQHGATAWTTLGALLGIEAAPPAPPARAQAVMVAPTPASGYASFSTYPSAPSPDSAPFGSLRPTVSELDIDEDMDFGRSRSSGKKKALVAFAVAALALVGFGVANPNRTAATWAKARSLLANTASAPVAAAAPPPAEIPVPAPAPPPAQPVATTPPVQSAQSAQSDADRLSDDKKKALLDADKAHAAQHQAKASAAAAAAPARRSSTYKSDGKTVFHKGGNKYDPLNSSL
jgi:hypothetical protein